MILLSLLTLLLSTFNNTRHTKPHIHVRHRSETSRQYSTMNATPASRALRASPRSAPATGPGSPAVTEASFSEGKRAHEQLPVPTHIFPVGTRIECDFTDSLYIGTVLRHAKDELKLGRGGGWW